MLLLPLRGLSSSTATTLLAVPVAFLSPQSIGRYNHCKSKPEKPSSPPPLSSSPAWSAAPSSYPAALAALNKPSLTALNSFYRTDLPLALRGSAAVAPSPPPTSAASWSGRSCGGSTASASSPSSPPSPTPPSSSLPARPSSRCRIWPGRWGSFSLLPFLSVAELGKQDDVLNWLDHEIIAYKNDATTGELIPIPMLSTTARDPDQLGDRLNQLQTVGSLFGMQGGSPSQMGSPSQTGSLLIWPDRSSILWLKISISGVGIHCFTGSKLALDRVIYGALRSESSSGI